MGWPNNYVQGVYNSGNELVGIDDGSGGTSYFTGVSTWESLPAASSSLYRQYRITDLNNSIFYSDGTNWRPLNGHATIAKGVGATVSTGTAEVSLVVVPIPANLMGINSSIRIAETYLYTSSVNTKTHRVRFGTNVDGLTGATILRASTRAGAGVIFDNLLSDLKNNNSRTSQIYHSIYPTLSGASVSISTDTRDTSAITYVSLTGQPATAGESIQLVNYCMELID